MSSRWYLRCFSSVVLLLGESLAFVAEVPQDLINGTVGQSVLLPLSYKFNSISHFPLPIQWTFNNSLYLLITCTVLNCSLSTEGTPQNCSAKCFKHAMYEGRLLLFPENGSLLLRDVRLSDSGVYSVTFKQQNLTRSITLTVYSPHFSLKSPDHNNSQKGSLRQIYAYVIGVSSCLISFLLLFLFFCIRHRGAVQRKKTGTIKQEVSTAEESPMESTMMRDVATVYATVGGSFEQPQRRATPETLYASVTFSASQGKRGPRSSRAAVVNPPQVEASNLARESPVSR